MLACGEVFGGKEMRTEICEGCPHTICNCDVCSFTSRRATVYIPDPPNPLPVIKHQRETEKNNWKATQQEHSRRLMK